MNLVGLLPVRNEDWVLGLSARVALMWCDQLVILNHASTDGTQDILDQLDREHPGRIVILYDSEAKWKEMEHRQLLLEWARPNVGNWTAATHIALIDADEILTGNLLGDIRGHIERLPRGGMLRLPGYNLRGGLNRYHANGIWGNRFFSLAFRDEPQAHWGGDNFHQREPLGIRWQGVQPFDHRSGGIMHLWASSERRLIAKHALFKCVERLRWPDKPVDEIDRMYSWAIKGDPGKALYGTPATWTYADVPREWWAPYDSISRGRLNVDGIPWQEDEVRRLVAEYGRERFSGLDLFGVA